MLHHTYCPTWGRWAWQCYLSALCLGLWLSWPVYYPEVPMKYLDAKESPKPSLIWGGTTSSYLALVLLVLVHPFSELKGHCRCFLCYPKSANELLIPSYSLCITWICFLPQQTQTLTQDLSYIKKILHYILNSSTAKELESWETLYIMSSWFFVSRSPWGI